MNTVLKRMLLSMAALLGVLGLTAGYASANSSQSLFGQCGGTVQSGSQLLASWNHMGVTSQATNVVASAGFHRMDNSLPVFMAQRVVRATLAASASPEDFGCHPGKLFSVGPRLIPKGTPVMVALPANLAKSDVSVVARKGFVRKMFTVRAVGKSNCSNPLRGSVKVWLWIKVKVVKTVPKPTPAPAPTPTTPTVNCPSGTVKDFAGNCVVVVVSCPAGSVKDSNGNCVTQTNTAAQNCAAKGGNWDNTTLLCTIIQVNGNCSTIIVVNGSGNTVNTSTTGNCNTAPPPPVCPAGTTGTPPNCVTPPSSCVTITSVIDLNDVPVGKTSQQLPFTVNSCGSGSITIDPGNGGISDCSSSTPQASITFSLATGNFSGCVIYYAPNDASATSGSITYTAIQGTAKDVKTDSFLITHPVRPT